MVRILTPSVAYFAIVFAAGFVLGTIRVLLLQWHTGLGTAFAFVELPAMLWISWRACGWMLATFAVSDCVAPRALIGLIAFALLMAAETVLAVLAFGRTLTDHIESYRQPMVAAGLVAQMAFAAFPVIRRRTR
jgi:hypothetical protein